jgi:hypothetical protein
VEGGPILIEVLFEEVAGIEDEGVLERGGVVVLEGLGGEALKLLDINFEGGGG